MFRIIFIPILAFASLAGCEQERVIDLDQLQDRNGMFYEVNATEGFTGTVVAGRYENGQKKGEATLLDGKLHGVATDFYDNGQKRDEGNFVNGELHGVHTEWFKNGQKRSETTFINGVRHGVQIKWNRDGQKEFEGNYLNGVLDGNTVTTHSPDDPGPAENVRRQVAEGMNLARVAQRAVTDFYVDLGRWPESNHEAGVSQPEEMGGIYAAFVEVNNGSITVGFRSAGGKTHSEIAGTTLLLEPFVEGGKVDWTCTSPSIDPHYLPTTCR